nr:hypothetical protein CFP56_01140 [Quercus suber]
MQTPLDICAPGITSLAMSTLTTRIQDPSVSTLSRLLNSLTAEVLPNSTERTTQYDRNRISANVEHARTMLLTLEKQSSTMRIASQRQAIQADLQAKRAVVKQLQARLEEMDSKSSDDEDDEDEDDPDTSRDYGPARTDTTSGLDMGEPQGLRLSSTQQSELRSRKPALTAHTDSVAATSGREQLFAGRQTDADLSSLKSHEALETHNRTQQAQLEQGLLSLVQSLKQSSLNIGASLEADKEVQARAQSGLEKTSGEMDAAQRSMGMLRRMSEGQGWWGRIKLYAFIFGLWVACFLVVFVGPKLRL